MSRRNITIIVILLVIAAFGFIGYQRFSSRESESATELETVPVEWGTIVATVNASGSIVPKVRAMLTFGMPGQVAEMAVEEGDLVKAGEALARLETKSLELAVAQAEAALAASEAQLDQLEKGARAEDVARAQAALTASEAQLEQLEKGARAEDVARAQAGLDAARANVASTEASLDSAEANLAKLLAGASERDIELARLNWDQAKNNLWATQARRDGIKGNPLSPGYEIDAAEAAVLQAEVAVRIAQVQYEQVKDGPTQEDIAMAQALVDQARGQVEGAQAQVAQAQATLDKLKAGPTPEELAIARAQVAQAQATLDKLKAGPTPEELAVAQAQIDQAKATLAQAELRLAEATIVAPFAGTVARVDISVGELASSAKPAIILVNLGTLSIDVSIDETDIGLVEVGQKASITFDAFPDASLSGQVLRIDPVGTVVQGVVNYGVRIETAPTEVAIKPDMTANVDILVERKEGVLLVPNRALRRDQEGKYVEVFIGGQPQRRYVTIGLSNESVTEVIEGLEDGELIVVSALPRSVFEEMGGFPFGQ